MKKLLASLLLVAVGNLWALDSTEQHYVDMITEGSLSSAKRASQEIFNSNEDNPAVLDYLAELLLQRYATASTGDIDTLSWAAKAIGKSGNPRYHDALAEVTQKSGNKKLKKYAEGALDDLKDKGSTPQYQRGGVSLKGGTSSKHQDSSTPKSSGGKGSLTNVQKGMTMSEAYAIAGEPTTSTGHVTGKAWIPFNFRGADTARLYALYKGKGRIIFTNRSHYDTSWSVYEVQVDASESGYP